MQEKWPAKRDLVLIILSVGVIVFFLIFGLLPE